MTNERPPNPLRDLKEPIARFLGEPTRENLKRLRDNYLGELDELDFKREWPSNSKLAKHVLALGNAGGGCIFVGIDLIDGVYQAVGLDKTKDPAEVSRGLRKFIPQLLDVFTLEFDFPEASYPILGPKRIQILLVRSSDSELPYVAQAAGDGIIEGVTYIRDGTESIPANYERVNELIGKRVRSYGSTQEIDLETYLQRLRRLYHELELLKTTKDVELMQYGSLMSFAEIRQSQLRNQNFLEHESFLTSLISELQARIRESLMR